MPPAKRPIILSRDHGTAVQERETRIQEFSRKASDAEIATLLSIMRRWPEIRALSSRDPLFVCEIQACDKQKLN